MRALLILLAATASAATVEVGVFGLFHAREITVAPADGTVIVVQGGGTLEGGQTLRCRLAQETVDCGSVRGASILIAARNGDARFLLSVPGKIERRFSGRLELRAEPTEIRALVTMDIETAVAAVTASEPVPGSGAEALKAQAVVARSFYLANPRRHAGYDFCDTTHCQYLREPNARSAAAASATRGLVLTYHGEPFAALYSASCGGRTRTLAEAGWQPDRYPYFAVACPLRKPHARRGHGLGMCQLGAAAMAAGGRRFQEILQRFYPASEVESPAR